MMYCSLWDYTDCRGVVTSEDAFNISATIPEDPRALQSFILPTAAATISGVTNIGVIGSAVGRSSADQENLMFSKSCSTHASFLQYHHHSLQGFPYHSSRCSHLECPEFPSLFMKPKLCSYRWVPVVSRYRSSPKTVPPVQVEILGPKEQDIL